MIAQQGTLEISASRLAANVALFRGRLPAGTAICATVKANAYGHGLAEVLPVLRKNGVDWACVYSLAEALEVARITPEMNVLVLAPVVLRDGVASGGATLSGAMLGAILGGRIRLDVVDKESALHLARQVAATSRGRPVRVHVQVDTGLTRTGVACGEALDLMETIAAAPGLELEGVFSHLSHGEVPGHETVTRQIACLLEVAAPVRRRHPRVLVHVQNSGGAWHVPARGAPSGHGPRRHRPLWIAALAE